MDKEVDGFVLSEVDYGESSKVINVFTNCGILGVMCKGVKRVKSKNRVSTMKLSYVRLNIKYKENKLSTLISSDIINPLKKIKSDIVLVAFLNYMSDLTHQVLRQSDRYEEIYEIFIKSILKMEEGLDSFVLANILEVKYLKYLGLSSAFLSCAVCGSDANLLSVDISKGGFICASCRHNEVVVPGNVVRLIKNYSLVDIAKVKKIEIDDNSKQFVNELLNEYYDRYTGIYLNSKNFLKSVLKF